MSQPRIFQVLFVFLLAGLCELGGGYMIWLSIREDYTFLLAVAGGFVLFLYSVVQTLQPAHFHRVYAAYGGIFIAMAMTFAWLVNDNIPDLFDVIGALVAVSGAAVVFFGPREREPCRD